jgi:hypothetical protein
LTSESENANRINHGPFSAMSVFKKGLIPQPSACDGCVAFLLDDLSDEMQSQMRGYLIMPGDYTCTYQPKINQLDVCGIAAVRGVLHRVRLCVDDTGFNRWVDPLDGKSSRDCQGETPYLLYEFQRLYSNK